MHRTLIALLLPAFAAPALAQTKPADEPPIVPSVERRELRLPRFPSRDFEVGAFLGTVNGLMLKMFGAIIFAMVLIATADWFWTRFQWRIDLKMTRQEVKDELKQSQGDPIIKARLRSVAYDRARKRMMNAVPTASLVIANPTHYAIALRYTREDGGAPIVVAKGTDLLALKIREIAEANDVPVIEDKLLARSMYDHVEIDQMIPPQFFKAVAEIIYYLYTRSGTKMGVATA